MEAVPGQTLLDLLLQRPWRIWGGPAQMADLHVRLHTLPVSGFPAPPGVFLERRLEEMRQYVHDHALGKLLRGLDWLHRHRPEPASTHSVIHLDFHPVNIMFHQDECSGVLDWSESDVGDRHADVAATLVLIRSAPVELESFSHRLSALPGRSMLYRRYLRAYRARLPVDGDKLAYYIAWAAFRRLVNWGMWLHAGPSITGSKPSSIRYLNAKRVNILRRCFSRWSSVNVSL